MTQTGDDIAALIQMSAGDPTLPAGQAPVLPEDNVPTTTAQIAANTGVSKELNPAQQANAATLHSLAAGGAAQTAPAAPMKQSNDAVKLAPPRVTNQLPPMVAGTPNLSVTDPGASAKVASLFQPAPPVAVVQQQPLGGQVPQQQMQPVTQTSEAETFEEIEDFAVCDGEWEENEEEQQQQQVHQQLATSQVPAPVALTSPAKVVEQPVQQQQPDPVAKMLIATAPTVATTQGPVKFPGDDELLEIQKLMTWIETTVMKARFDSGIALIGNPQHRDPNNYIHTSIYRVRWEAQGLYNLGPHELLAMEAALTAHQVWVQGEENYWAARHTAMRTELERIVFIKRENYSAPTKTESENRLISAEPEVRKFRAEYMLTQAMATLYKEQGLRFAQFEDGIKRTITMAVEEFNRSKIQARHQ